MNGQLTKQKRNFFPGIYLTEGYYLDYMKKCTIKMINNLILKWAIELNIRFSKKKYKCLRNTSKVLNILYCCANTEKYFRICLTSVIMVFIRNINDRKYRCGYSKREVLYTWVGG